MVGALLPLCTRSLGPVTSSSQRVDLRINRSHTTSVLYKALQYGFFNSSNIRSQHEIRRRIQTSFRYALRNAWARIGVWKSQNTRYPGYFCTIGLPWVPCRESEPNCVVRLFWGTAWNARSLGVCKCCSLACRKSPLVVTPTRRWRM
jgi:hypothetical protein